VMGPFMYLARCPINAPDSVVTELSDDIFLVGCGPYKNGLDLHSSIAPAEKVASYRAFVKKSNIEREKRETAENAAAAVIDSIKDVLRGYADRHPDPDTRKTASNRLNNWQHSSPSLKDIIILCGQLEISFSKIVQEASA
ncbi:MAG: hypothetical protein WAQ27_00470, partial [Candidatus Microsaccharimonas sp.]